VAPLPVPVANQLMPELALQNSLVAPAVAALLVAVQARSSAYFVVLP
jgi:hypothetical protein